ncbi:MAG: two-component regulator propeller domain-containing protein [Candidatus Zixiibacteriota bacterium]
MILRYIGVILGLALIVTLGCSGDDETIVGPADTTPPADILNLTASDPSGSTVTLVWTASGDDGVLARADHYEIKYSISPITEDNWSAATTVADPPYPSVVGYPDTCIVSGLSPVTTYYFAVKVADEADNWSGISNVVSATTLLAGSWSVYTESNSGLPSDMVRDIAATGYGRFFATNAGLAHLNGLTWTIFDTANSYIPGDDLTCLAVDGTGMLWIGTSSAGLSRFNGATFTNYSSDSTSLLSNSINSIAVSPDNEIWVGTTGGIFHQVDTGWVNYNTSNTSGGLNSNIIGSLAFDSAGYLWIGYNYGGASRFDGVNFEDFNAGDGFTSGGVISILPTAGRVWFGTEQGAFSYDGSDWSVLNTSNSELTSDVIFSIAVDLAGHRWFATNDGVFRYDGAAWTHYTTVNSLLPDNVVNMVKTDAYGTIWIGTEGGAAAFDD